MYSCFIFAIDFCFVYNKWFAAAQKKRIIIIMMNIDRILRRMQIKNGISNAGNIENYLRKSIVIRILCHAFGCCSMWTFHRCWFVHTDCASAGHVTNRLANTRCFAQTVAIPMKLNNNFNSPDLLIYMSFILASLEILTSEHGTTAHYFSTFNLPRFILQSIDSIQTLFSLWMNRSTSFHIDCICHVWCNSRVTCDNLSLTSSLSTDFVIDFYIPRRLRSSKINSSKPNAKSTIWKELSWWVFDSYRFIVRYSKYT